MFKDFQVKAISKDVVAPANLLKKRLWHLYFPVNFANFKNTLYIEHLRWLLLIIKFSPLNQ